MIINRIHYYHKHHEKTMLGSQQRSIGNIIQWLYFTFESIDIIDHQLNCIDLSTILEVIMSWKNYLPTRKTY